MSKDICDEFALINEYQKALNVINNFFEWNSTEEQKIKYPFQYSYKLVSDSIDKLQALIGMCSKPNSIKLKLDHIQDVLQCSYETDINGKYYVSDWNNDVNLAEEYLRDIKQAYSFRVEDTRIVNELQELLGCSVDNIVKTVNEMRKEIKK